MKYLILLLVFIGHTLAAQPTYLNLIIDIDSVGQAFAQNIIEVDSFYYFAGGTGGGPLPDTGTVVRINKYTGDFVYAKNQFSVGNSNDFIFPILESDQLVVAGIDNDPDFNNGETDFTLFEIDPHTLNSITRKSYGYPFSRDDIIRDATPTRDSGYIMTGFSNANNDYASIFVLKVDKNLEEEWKTLHPNNAVINNNYIGYRVIETSTNEFIIVGWRRMVGSGLVTLQFLKFSQTGELLLIKETFPTGQEEGVFPGGIIELDGNFIVGGIKRVYAFQVLAGLTQDRYWFYSLDIDGNILWSTEYDECISTVVNAIIPSGDGNFIVCGGESEIPFIVDNMYVSNRVWATLSKISPTGERIWHRRYSEEESNARRDLFNNVIITEDNGILLIGDTRKDSTFQDYWVLKLDSMGCKFPGCDSLKPTADFSYTIDDLTVSFKSESQGEIENYLWQYGRVFIEDFVEEPIHTFLDTGSYEICLQVANDYGKDKVCKTIDLLTTGTSTPKALLDIKLFPNPNEGLFFVEIPDMYTIKNVQVFDMSGNIIYFEKQTNNNLFEIDISEAAAGTYIIRIETEEGEFVDKVVRR